MSTIDDVTSMATGVIRGPSGVILRRFGQGCFLSAFQVWIWLLSGRNLLMHWLRRLPLDLETPAFWLGLVVGFVVALALAIVVVVVALPIILLALALACIFAAGRALFGGHD